VERRLFALDHNFPQPIVAVLSEYMVEAELVAVDAIDPRMTELDDWEVLLALHHHARPWDGLITTDNSMIQLPRELSVLMQSKLTLVVADAAGHDPLKATGLVLAHLPGICRRTRPDVAQAWVLRAPQRPHDDPWSLLERVAAHQGRDPDALYAEARLSPAELRIDPLASA
jgi:hypothetical protein